MVGIGYSYLPTLVQTLLGSAAPGGLVLRASLELPPVSGPPVEASRGCLRVSPTPPSMTGCGHYGGEA